MAGGKCRPDGHDSGSSQKKYAIVHFGPFFGLAARVDSAARRIPVWNVEDGLFAPGNPAKSAVDAGGWIPIIRALAATPPSSIWLFKP